MDFKKSNAPRNTSTLNHNTLDAPTGNIYESLVIISKRAAQIQDSIKMELQEKLEEFATHTESLEEIFENKEQIEVSRFYESLPKPTAMATQEWLDNKVYYRIPEGVDPNKEA